MDRAEKQRELQELRERAQRLEAELADAGDRNWPPREFYTTYYVLGGFVLGSIGAAASLLFNIVGSLLVGQHPLQLIRVYLTFPLGDAALHVDSGLALAVGCCLYIFTGMVLGIPFHLVLSRWFARTPLVSRLVVAGVMALALWLINFYVLIAWLQPALFGGDWIIRELPWWVGALTHLVFGWTMVLVQPLGRFISPMPTMAEAS
jgi:hypothetical protein